jgi:hypothetical protein
MLADVTEAAVRTIEKPNAQKIEKFIQDLMAQKVEHGQLSQSELTFRDLETIKNAFVRVLVAYYHSRIEYPKIDPSPAITGSKSFPDMSQDDDDVEVLEENNEPDGNEAAPSEAIKE